MSQDLEIPKLENYGLTASSGFLPGEFPVTRLSDKYYKPWETIVGKLPSLLLSKKIRSVVDRLPTLEVKTSLLENLAELRRSYSVLCFITNAYIWGYDEPCEILPDCVAQPLLIISEKLGLPPLATYAGLVLWNFEPVVDLDLPAFLDGDFDLHDIMTINTFTGGIDESWFYLVSVFFERTGAQCMENGLKAIHDVRNGNSESLVGHLESIAEGIDGLGSILMRMDEMCDPHIFYFRIRPYLAGWRNMEDVGLPKGVKYGKKGSFQQYAGGSNAQSSLIQMLDILLGVEHFSSGKKHSAGGKISAKTGSNSFINEMRNYMPREHRNFLEHLEKVSNIRDYVLSHKNDEKLLVAYDACLAMLKSFRDKHIQIVTRYVVMQASKKSVAGKGNTLRSGLSKSHGKKEQKGTGGTSLMPFLKQCRDETGVAAASEWGQKILSAGVLKVEDSSSIVGIKKHSPSEIDDGGNVVSKKMKLGLAGDWSSEEDNEESEVRHAGHW